MKHLVVGILAHVDAGKTTLAESLLFEAGALRSKGRVDEGSAFLDFNATERARGITIFSAQATLEWEDAQITLLDTPGHVDFSTETERSLHVLDYAVLVIDASHGVQGHTETLWTLLRSHNIPTLVFFNKMDLAEADPEGLIAQAERRLGAGFFAASAMEDQAVQEALALLDDQALEEFFEQGSLASERINSLFTSGKAFPCFFGSALRAEGISEFLSGLNTFAAEPQRKSTFAARTYKVTHDDSGARLLWMKVTGGALTAKMLISADDVRTPNGASIEESGKVEQIRIYSGSKFQAVSEVLPGQTCAVLGLPSIPLGSALGDDAPAPLPQLAPVLVYKVEYGTQDVHVVAKALRTLAQEDPALQCAWDVELQELRVHIMGAIQLEVLQATLEQRFNLHVSFAEGSVLYMETIASPVRGVGHYEPLKHYAEVHYLLEPLPRGAGIEFGSVCKLDNLDLNWQRLTLGNAQERPHRGVLMGAQLTDVRMTLLGGRAHLKHTEGGDFRQATYRCVRQALMQAREQGQCVLLEPYYQFHLTVPEDKLGRALADLQRMSARFDAPQMAGTVDDPWARISGFAPAAEMQHYPLELATYSQGRASISCLFSGYEPCHNTQAVLDAHPYDPEADLPNSPDSVFCAHGAGYTVKWQDVPDAAHVVIDERDLGPWISAAEL